MLENPYDEQTSISKGERDRLRKILGAFLAGCFALILVALATGAWADDVFKSVNELGPVALRLKQEPCTDTRVLGWLTSKYRAPAAMIAKFKAAVLTYGGKDWASCWIEDSGYVVSVDEEGARLQDIPRDLFKDPAV